MEKRFGGEINMLIKQKSPARGLFIRYSGVILEFTCYFHFFECFDDVTDLNIIEFVNVQTTLVVVFHFFHIDREYAFSGRAQK